MKKQNKSDSNAIREKAEKLLDRRRDKACLVSIKETKTETGMLKLIYELEVHQVELEMLNDELSLAKEQSEIASEKYTELYDFAPTGYFSLSKEGKIIQLNLMGAKMLGKERINLINTRFGLFVSYNSILAFNLFLENSFRSHVKETCEVIILANGILPTYVHLSGIVSEYGEQCLVTATDITEQKQAEMALREDEKRLIDITLSMDDWVWEVDENGVYTYSSERSTDFFGRTNESILGKTPFDFMPPDEAKRTAALFAEIAANKAPIKDLENWNIGKNGEKICVLTNGVPILDEKGNLKGYRGVDKDITERKHNEQAIIDSLSITDAIINSVHNGILAVGINGNVFKTNSKFAELWRIPENILNSGDDKTLLSYILDQLADPNEFIAKVEELYRNQDAASLDFIHFKDRRTFERISRPIYIGGKPNGRIWSFLDITERRIAEEKERRYASGLAVLAEAAVKYISISRDENIYDYIKDVLQALTGAKYVIINSYNKTSNTLTTESFYADESIKKQMGQLLGGTIEGFTMKPEDYIITELLRKQILPVSGGLYELSGKKIPQEICQSMEKLMNIGDVFSMGLCVGSDLYGTAALLLKEGDIIENTDIFDTFINQTSAALQRKSIDESLKQSERNLLEAQRLAKIGSWEWIPSTDTVTWSDELFNIAGRDPIFPAPKFAEMSSCFAPGSWKLLAAKVTRALQKGEPFTLDIEMKRPDGEFVPTHVRGIANYDAEGKITGLSGTVQDITEQKKAEEALKNSENRMRDIIEAIPDLMFTINNQGTFISYKAAIEDLAYQTQSIIGKNSHEIMPIEFAEFMDEKINLTLQMGQMQVFEYQLPLPAKGICNFEARMVPGGADNVIAIVRDITERKKNEAEILRINKDLKQSNVTKDKFFSIIAHDLKGPFNGFLGLTQIMADDLPSLTMTEIQEIAVSMRNSAGSLYGLLENLLHWARMQQGLIPFEPKKMTLLPIVRESVDLLAESAKNKGIDIFYDIPSDLMVFADENMLQTVIRNLVSNALKFTPKGGNVSVLAKLNTDQSVEISVKDTGIGMSSEMVENLFRLDAKTGRTGTEGEPSTGLGLMLCKEFVVKHGGNIWVESEEEKGSTFYFTVPNNNT